MLSLLPPGTGKEENSKSTRISCYTHLLCHIYNGKSDVKSPSEGINEEEVGTFPTLVTPP
jgi:hypothetical protein